MGFYAILCPRPSSAPEDSYCIIIRDYLSVVSRRFYPPIMYIMSQSPPSYFRIDTLSPSAPTVFSSAKAPASAKTPAPALAAGHAISSGATGSLE